MKKRFLLPVVIVILLSTFIYSLGYTENYVKAREFFKELFSIADESESVKYEESQNSSIEASDIEELINDQKIERLVIPTASFNVELGQARLSGNAGSLYENLMLSINKHSVEELPALDPGMINVTGDNSFYRMLPHGTRFAKDINIVLPYDKGLLPFGFNEEDIYTYYYDEAYKSWVEISRDSVDVGRGVVVSSVNHFTDFINAVIITPEMPETNAYVPTTMSGIQAGNPFDGLAFIQAPGANNSGTANLSYPIDIPAGRQGMQPNLNITYSSNGGSGWLGQGWDLNFPSITIETRWGVPYYDAEKESETYLLNGEQLLSKNENGEFNPLTFRDDWKDRMSGDVEFGRRIEGEFQKIIRHGDSPKNYWWEVIDKDGLRYFYGKKFGPNNNSFDSEAVLKDHSGNIGRWHLTEIRDLNENFIYYKYKSTFNDGYVGIYPKEITYTGNGATAGRYKVEFVSTTKQTFGQSDLQNNCRLGINELASELLSGIKIKYNNATFKQYKFCYKNGGFDKTLLESISELTPECFDNNNSNCNCGSNYGKIYTHVFEYYEKPENIFGEEITINAQTDNDVSGLVSPAIGLKPTSLGGSMTTSWGVGGAVTAGIGVNAYSKLASGGGNYMRSGSNTKGILTLIDMDGDGLPDKLIRKLNGRLYYRKQICNNGVYSFGPSIEITGLNYSLSFSFSSEKSRIDDWGYEAHAGLYTKAGNQSNTRTITDIYMSDVNSDGLPDIVHNGYVYFNHLNNNGVPTFSLTSPTSIIVEGGNCGDAGSPVGSEGDGDSSDTYGETVSRELFEPGTELITERVWKDGSVTYNTVYPGESRVEYYPEHDLVKMWIAPYRGQIKIDAPVYLTENLMESRINSEITDGLIVSVQINNEIKYKKHLKPGEIESVIPDLGTPFVNKGDRIYFRIESVHTREYDKVAWVPEITYLSINGNSSNFINDQVRDPNGKKIYVFNSSDDFLINYRREYKMPLEGSVAVKSNFRITEPLSSGITVKIYKDDNPVYENYFQRGATVNTNIDILTNLINVVEGTRFRFEVESRTEVNWHAIDWKPVLYYSAIQDEEISENNDMVFESVSVPNIAYDIIPYFTCYPNPILPSRQYRQTENILLSSISVFLNGAYGQSNYLLSIKDQNGTVYEDSVYNISNGSNVYQQLSSNVYLYAGKTYYFDLYSLKNNIVENINDAYLKFIDVNNDTTSTYACGLRTIHKTDNLIFGDLYNNWGQFNYLNGTGEYTTAINESSLGFSQEFIDAYNDEDPNAFLDFDWATEVFLPMEPDYFNNQWVGYGNMSYVNSDTISNAHPVVVHSSILGNQTIPDNIDFLPYQINTINNVPALAPKKMSESVNFSNQNGADFLIGSFGGTTNNGNIWLLSDFIDMNGDGYPDVVSDKGIQFSQPRGGLSGLLKGHAILELDSTEHLSDLIRYSGTGKNFGASFSSVLYRNLSDRQSGQVETKDNSGKSYGLSAGVSPADNGDYTQCTWIDINGDGLPDKVLANGKVFINSGYKFLEPYNIDTYGAIKKGSSHSFGGNAGGGGGFDDMQDILSNLNIGEYNRGGTSFSGGFGLNRTMNRTEVLYMDINGDGFPDRLELNSSDNNYDDVEIKVRYNLGGKFFSSSEILLDRGQILKTHSFTGSTNGAVSFGYSFTIGYIVIKFIFNPKANVSWGMNRTKSQFIDMDGDGLPDYVTSDDINELKVRYNQSGKTNLLKSVTNIANGKFIVDYEQSQPSYECPNRSWTMSSLKIYDGFRGDGIDTLYYTFEYDSARYDRFNRENLCFGKVVTKQKDITNNLVYRTTTERYHNNEYIRKGLRYYELLTNSGNKKLIEKFYNYGLHNIETGEVIDENNFCHGTGYPAIYEELTKYYEGGTTARITTRKSYTYGRYGNITEYYNYGDMADTRDDLRGIITYHEDPNNKYIVGIQKSVNVTNINPFSGYHRKRVSEIDYNTGKTTSITIYNSPYSDGSSRVVEYTSVYNYEYDTYGNIKKVKYPKNNNDQIMEYSYVYDSYNYTYVTRVTSVPFGYYSTAAYDYRWGKPMNTRDINGNITYYTYDWYGRVYRIRSPYETDYTIKYYYWFDKDINYLPGENPCLPWAVTYNYDYQYPDYPMTTTLFCDAAGKVIQTKKNMLASIRGILQNKVSGKVFYDAYGRAQVEYYPIVENAPASVNHNVRPEVTYNSGVDNIEPTRYGYDELDRQKTIRLPDGMLTEYSYGLYTDNSGIYRFRSMVTDANGKTTYQFSDPRGLTTMTVDARGGKTYFEYNSMGELIKSKDPDGFETEYTYNKTGQQTSRKHPDAGRNIYSYDPAGNLITNMTQKLTGSRKFISYVYDYNRLTEIQYPENPEMNVKYTYGNNSATNNRKGRVYQVDDASGLHTYSYGAFGEITEDIRTYILPVESAASVYKMAYEYDSWNRIKKIIYPDGEEITYTYDRGGLLQKVTGMDNGNTYEYVKNINYNKFDQKVSVLFGNGTANLYIYDIITGRLDNLKTTAIMDGRVVNTLDIKYGYDYVGNIIAINNIADYLSNGMGSKYENNYKYDNIYRLSKYESRTSIKPGPSIPPLTGTTTGNMEYSANGRILNKTVTNSSTSVVTIENIYKYDSSQPNTLTSLLSTNSTDAGQSFEKSYTWDANGNMNNIINNNKVSELKWNENDQLISYMDNSRGSYYLYNYMGERVYKNHGSKMSLGINGNLIQYFALLNPVLYAFPYLAVTPRGYTKHIFAGSERIASKVINVTLSPQVPDLPQSYINEKIESSRAMLSRAIPVKLRKAPIGIEVPIQSESISTQSASESDIYYYHSDHLGSSSWITYTDGSPVQYLSYLPFGETSINHQRTDWSARYTFSGKEKDEETGFHYFGARYYDSDLSIWLSVDPMAGKYPSLSPYVYCANNPIRYIDPDGMDWEDADGNKIKDHSNIKAYIFYDPKSFKSQSKTMYKELESKYGKGSVAMSNVTTTKEFAQDWGNMASIDIKEVNLNYHGRPLTLNLDWENDQYITSYGNKTPLGNPAMEVSKLPTPSGNIWNAQLNINSCESNNVDILPNNFTTIAQSFRNNTYFYSIRTTAKGVSYFNWFSPNRPHPQDDSSWQFLYRPALPKYRGEGLPPK